MYVEAICPLCFACHVLPEEMRGQRHRCEQCEEVFIVSKKAKTTNKKPARPRSVKPAEGPEEVVPVEAAEVLPEAKIIEQPPPKKAKPTDEGEVLEIPDEALQSAAPAAKPAAAPRSRRPVDDEDEDRPRKRRPRDDDDDDEEDRPRRSRQRSGGSKGLVVVLCVVGVFLLSGIAFGAWWALSDKNEDDNSQTQGDNSATKKEKAPPKPPPADPPKKDPPRRDPPPKQEKPVIPPKKDPPILKEWTVQIDPGAPVTLPADYSKEVKGPTSIAMAEVEFPSAPSSFVLIGSNRGPKQERQLWDLKTGEMTGRLSGRIPMLGRPVLSADGAHLAFVPQTNRTIVEVRDIAKSTAISVDVGMEGPHTLLDFAGADKLIVGHRQDNNGMTCRLYNVTTGQKERELETVHPGVPWPRAALAISPGGNYLAVVDPNNLSVYDLRTGELTGQRALAKPLDGLECRGLSFSPDGKELAAVLFTKPSAQLLCWRVNDGKVVADINFPQAEPQMAILTTSGANAVGWLGDGRGWLLYGTTVINRKKNHTATFLSASPIAVGGLGVLPRYVIGPEHVATLKNGANRNEVIVSVGPFDVDKPK